MDDAAFKKLIWNFYAKNKRDFPWRQTTDPYRILVSEIMLQQTQTHRVIPKYEAWLAQFPTPQSLANASLRDVLKAWQGLGYNRRALALKRAAETIVQKHGGIFPTAYANILNLPGIGPYTAGAVSAFAFNIPLPIIETNIRTVFIHHYFKNHGNIHDKEILSLVERTLDRKHPRGWYWALMDYGAHLKKTIGNPNKKSTHYVRQSAFKGSNREIRSSLLRLIAERPRTSRSLHKGILSINKGVTPEQIQKNLDALIQEGFIVKEKSSFAISS